MSDLEKSSMQALCNQRRAAKLIERILTIRTRLMDPFSMLPSPARVEAKKWHHNKTFQDSGFWYYTEIILQKKFSKNFEKSLEKKVFLRKLKKIYF